MKLWFIELALFVIVMYLFIISLTLFSHKLIAEIELCKDSPTLVIKRSVFLSDCNCEKLLKKYSIKVKGE
jgi:hypothetical protein